MSSGGDNAKEKSVSDATHVAANEDESRLSRGDHSRDYSVEYVGTIRKRQGNPTSPLGSDVVINFGG